MSTGCVFVLKKAGGADVWGRDNSWVPDPLVFKGPGLESTSSKRLSRDYSTHPPLAVGTPSESHYRARYYDQSVGRFLSEDPLGSNEGGPNLYAYVSNSPVGNEDPLGRFTIDPSCKGRCHGFGNPPTMQPLDQAIQQQGDLACSNLQGIDPKWRSCIQQSCKKGKVKCKGNDDKNCQDAGGYGGKTLGIFTNRTANLCPDNWPDSTSLSYVGQALIHEWAHGCGWDHGMGGGVPLDPGKKGKK